MSLQFIIGSSGIGKTHYACQRIIQESLENPGKLYYIIVPEQFTMQTQKNVVEMHPGKGILNIDVLSFQRLAYRVFEEVGGAREVLLDDTGKSLVLQKLVQQHKKELPYLGSQMNKPGYLDEVKSLISEFMQYDIRQEELSDMLEKTGEDSLLQMKMNDVSVLYQAFTDYLEGHYMTGEGVMDALKKAIPFSRKLKNSVLLLDGFTGFTPVQMNVIRELLAVCDQVLVTVTMDVKENPLQMGKPHQLFYMSRKMIHTLSGLINDLDDPVYLKEEKKGRFSDAPALGFLEQHLFRYRKAAYGKSQDEIRIFAAESPIKELEETARRIRRMVREEDLKYGEIAVITGNLESYKSIASQVFEEAQIPYFLDEKHSILMNPFVEYIRAALEMVTKGFTYESVFRYLRCGMSGITREQADQLENYVLANGINSRRRWEEPWDEQEEPFKEKILPPLLAFVDQVREKAGTVRQKTEALYDLMVHYGIEQKMQDYREKFEQEEAYDLAREYEQIYGIVIELFDKLVELLGDEPMSLQEYTEILDAGFEEAKVGMIPPTMDCVLVGDIERTRLKDIKVLFFLGLNDGWVPKKEEKTSILSDMDRETLSELGMELAPTARENSYIQKFYLYLNLTKPSAKLYLSYGRMGLDGRVLRPSYVVGSILRMFPQLTLQDEDLIEDPLARITTAESGIVHLADGLRKAALGSVEKTAASLFGWYEGQEKYQDLAKKLLDAAFLHGKTEPMSKTTAKRLYGQTLVNSVSRLEKFSACSYAHFLNYGLRVSQRDLFVFQPVDMGNIFHKVLESYARKVEASEYTWFNIPEKEQKRLAAETVEEVSEAYASTLLHSSARNEYVIRRMKRIMERTIWALTRQVRAGNFIPSNFEVPFLSSSDLKAVNIALSDEETMRLKGRIDRIDLYETEDEVLVKVVDYKSGNKVFDLQEFYYGLQMQLVVYLNAALEMEQRIHPDKKIKPAGIFYYAMKDPIVDQKHGESEEELEKRILKELRPNGLVNAESEVVEALDRSLEKTSEVIPVARNKDGSYSRYASVASEEQFLTLSKFVEEKMRAIGCAILEGDVKINPYEKKGKTACDYCEFKDICGFDRKIPGMHYRRLKELDPDDIWEFLREGGDF